ncbi:MT-A70-domain-containing protein [Meira miltonrushii]|uniref:MT-A70-domain-containing protein n=1 Tax=Meira miltonrushii TaxID=1280837 RepID=A0A316VJL9_9BASI|nr:MT-A70-domain-containing protein [Meira miltonrushii]PWN37799.1 MT-A70-domain-containing protein [Meira miltonrushii]
MNLEQFRLQRQSIRERHAKVLNTIQKEKVKEAPLQSIRQHPRWKELMEKKKGTNNTSQNEVINSEMGEKDHIFGPAFIPSESTIRNDYSQRFIDTKASELPGNAVKNPLKSSRFEEYPKLRNLIDAKAKLLDEISIPPTYLQADLLQSIKPYAHTTNDPSEQPGAQFHLSSLLPIKYDVVIIDPPLEAYEWESVPTNGERSKQVWSWEQIAALPIPQIMAKESFVFFWVGSGGSDGLERGREVLNKWGFRRCEDIVWIRTNANGGENSETILQEPSSSAFHRTAEHCLMGIRGTVRRSTDTRFVHCNIDTDVILWPGEAADDKSGPGAQTVIDMRSKPPEMMDLIENFCLGTRRLELFGRNRNLRRGWLTVGLEVGPDKPGWERAVQGTNACAASPIDGHSSNNVSRQVPVPYHKDQYDSAFYVDRAGCTLAERANLVPYDEKIDDLRPKSPKPSSNQRRERTNTRQDSPYQVNSPMGGAYISPSNVQHMASTMASTSGEIQTGNPYQESMAGFLPQPQTSATFQPGGAGLSGLGAGGRSVVSVPSGSELLSGAQASVMLGQGQRPTNASAGGGPSGLSRRTRRGA